MATSRFKPRGSVLLCTVLTIACAAQVAPALNGSARANDLAVIQTIAIEHVTPRRDFVGPVPVKLEWTAVAGADRYAIKVEDEIEIPVFDQDGITTTSVPWPKEVRIPPGTYFWRIVGFKGSRLIADSGRAAFVVQEP